VRRDLGRRGRTPKYKLDRYGPHSKEAFDADVIALSKEWEISADARERRSALMATTKVHCSRISSKDEDSFLKVIWALTGCARPCLPSSTAFSWPVFALFETQKLSRFQTLSKTRITQRFNETIIKRTSGLERMVLDQSFIIFVAISFGEPYPCSMMSA
jgi:hypothetical protein